MDTPDFARCPRRRMARSAAALSLLWFPGALLLAGDLAPISSRLSPAAPDSETPDFQRHVLPLLSRAGCNGRECHGSAQGKGGFQLSLFGYDFDADYKAMTSLVEKHGTARVDQANPEDSLLLKKPTRRVDHKGGRKIEPGSWQYDLLLRWIQAGAPAASKQQHFERLEVEPGEILFRESGETADLRVVAVWSDGRREDVTELSRFQSNNEAVAAIEPSGRITAKGAGDTHIVAFYDNGVAAIPVLRPFFAATTPAGASPEATTTVDRLIGEKLGKLGIAPSERCGDTDFLRRISIDMTGTLPAPAEIEDFVADTRPDKRARKIEELLERPAYAAWWANKLGDFTGNNPGQQAELGQELASQWYDWMFRRIRDNQPYDELIADIVLATGRSEGQSYEA